MPIVELSLEEIVAEQERRRRGEELREEADRLAGSLREFTRAAWPLLEPATPFKPNWHIDAISEHLEGCRKREIRRLVINIPPRHMKSLNVTVLWPSWWWASEPWVRFLSASYGEKLATRDAVKSRRLIESAWYRARWGHVFRLLRDQNQKARYENDQTGYRIATSVGGTGTGEGGDVIILDDPHKADEVESDVERENVLDWHAGVISTRFNDPATGVEVLVMQRLHEDDLTGHLLELGGWEHLCLPAEYEPEHPFVWPDDPRNEPGELLWPDHIGPDELAEIKKNLESPYREAGQLQQRPAPAEGGLFKLGGLRYFPPEHLEPPSPLTFTRIVSSWDTTFKDKLENDYVVGACWGVKGANRYLLRVMRDRMSLAETKRAIREMHGWAEATYPGLAHSTLIENTANGPDIIAELRHEITGIVAVTVRGDKKMRAHAVSPIWESGNVLVPGFPRADGVGFDGARTPGWVQQWIAEHTSFPNASHDDQVDTTSQVLNWLRRVADPAAQAERDRQRGESAGVRTKTF